MTLELLLSGRLVPLSLMPDWAQTLADLMPFKWTFGFPIEALIGQLSDLRAARRAGGAGDLDRSRCRWPLRLVVAAGRSSVIRR